MTQQDMNEVKKAKKFDFGRIKMLILLGVLIYMVVTYINHQAVLQTHQQRYEELAAQKEELQREIDFRTNELNYIGTDEYIEQQARARLGWLLEDETKYVVSSEEKSSTQPSKEEDAAANAAAAEETPSASPSPTQAPTDAQEE